MDRKRGIGILCAMVLSACTQTPQTKDQVEGVLGDMDMVRDRSVDSIRDYRIDGWRYVDSYHVILTARRDENYLVSFMSPCMGTRGNFSIGFTSTAGGVTQFDDIVVQGPGGMTEICRIKEIIRLRDSE